MLRLRLRSFSSRAYTVVLLVCSCFLSPDSTHARGEDASGNPQEGIASGGDRRKKIAVIGAGISGTFVTKYLAEYDEKCLIDSIVLFDPRNDESGLQGGRVRSLRRDDGSVVELGASIIYSGNILAKEVVDADPNLVDVPPHSSGLHKDGSDTTADKLNMAKGFGIWDGKEFTLLTSTTADFLMKFKYLYRYNFDLIRLSRAVSKAANSFSLIYKLLDSNKPSTYFSSADEIWNVCGLLDASRMSFDNLLDSLGVAQNIAYWRSFLPWQRSLRKELVIGANLSNYNQNNAELNGKSFQAVVNLGVTSYLCFLTYAGVDLLL